MNEAWEASNTPNEVVMAAKRTPGSHHSYVPKLIKLDC